MQGARSPWSTCACVRHWSSWSISCTWFFFQAEDGIRAHCVTGVQTCALPIFPHQVRDRLETRGRVGAPHRGEGRSEERRVGKECRCRGSQDHEKKNVSETG